MAKKLLLFTAAAMWLPLLVFAQQIRIVGKIDNNQRITLRGHLHPRALPQFDQGRLDPGMRLSRVTVALKPSAAQQADLDQLLAQQQDPSSPNYHKWLTPEQFAERFGASQADVDKVVQWLQSQNLKVTSVARGRNAISVSGTAAAVESAFRVELHRFVINGESHFANATEPSVPAAFDGVIGGIRGLNNFRLRPASKVRLVLPRGARPKYTSGDCGGNCIAPEDFATIYNLKPLYQSGLNGSGQKIVVVGQTDIRLADIQEFRSTFNLPAINLQQILVPNSTDPLISSGDLGESDLDLELSGAIAPNATIIFVYSDDVETSAEYAIDQNLAPVISMSYGDCEAAYQASDATSMRALAQQANAQGITWLAASGDNGATDCYGDGSGNDNVVSVDMPASIPEVTGVGGTEFNEGSGTYWNATNDANGGSAISYIPETAWNDSSIDGSPSASGGGVSVYFTKPSWQTGTGVPNDGVRDVPDIALSASADHDPYMIYSSDGCREGRVVETCLQYVGGTSVGPPQMAGLLALLNQQLVNSGSSAGLGNINPQL
ncbi:MAG: S8/S53 family peptidase, partial [Acidobacteriia bacterium]|nr:S8/S53 family peptidase [Terriglobia bacterium]